MICNGVVDFLFKVWQKAGSLVCDLTILILSKGKAPKWEEKIFFGKYVDSNTRLSNVL